MGAGEAAVVKRTMPLRALIAWMLVLPKMDMVCARLGLSSFALRRRWIRMSVFATKRVQRRIPLTMRPQKSDMVTGYRSRSELRLEAGDVGDNQTAGTIGSEAIAPLVQPNMKSRPT
jgi:hypothetical protein